MVTSAQRQILGELQATRWKFYNVPRDVGQFLHLLIQLGGFLHPIEVGTANGYSGIWIASALPKDGKLVTIERDGLIAREAEGNFARAGLADVVDLQVGGAFKILKRVSGTFDFVFLDATKIEYRGYFERLQPLLSERCLIVADNVISSEREMVDFLDMMSAQSDFTTMRLPMHNGILLAYRMPVSDRPPTYEAVEAILPERVRAVSKRYEEQIRNRA